MAVEIRACVCGWETEAAASVCPHNTLAVVKAGSYQVHPAKTAGNEGGGAHIYNSKKKYIITLNQSTMLPVGQS